MTKDSIILFATHEEWQITLNIAGLRFSAKRCHLSYLIKPVTFDDLTKTGFNNCRKSSQNIMASYEPYRPKGIKHRFQLIWSQTVPRRQVVSKPSFTYFGAKEQSCTAIPSEQTYQKML